MAIYAISDLHLSFGVTEKPMDIFNDRWDNYIERLVQNWRKKIKEEDTVLIAGDFSWATYLQDTLPDFRFLEDLPGQKIILKGNHDYWWTTLKKMNEFLKQNEIKTVSFLHNNAFEVEDYLIAGVRYWNHEEGYDNDKILNRECERAKISLEKAKEINSEKPIIFVTHYPPDERIIKCIDGYNVKKWIYGHIHSNYEESLVEIDGVDTYLTSCDYLEFDAFKVE